MLICLCGGSSSLSASLSLVHLDKKSAGSGQHLQLRRLNSNDLFSTDIQRFIEEDVIYSRNSAVDDWFSVVISCLFCPRWFSLKAAVG